MTVYIFTDISEIPICESTISCDNLLCDGHGRPPNPSVVVQVTTQNRKSWVKYGRTEVIEVCCTDFHSSSVKTMISFLSFSDVRIRNSCVR